MANSKSSQKRIQINKRNRVINRYYTGTINKELKKTKASLTALYEGKTSSYDTRYQVNQYISRLDKGVKNGVLHKNKAVRKKTSVYKSYKTIRKIIYYLNTMNYT